MSEEGYVSGSTANVGAMDDDYSDRKGRSKFSTKVLVTVVIQFGVLVAFCNGFLYDENLQSWIRNAQSTWWPILLVCLLVPLVLIGFMMKPALMTEAPKCYVSLVFLTCLIGCFTGFVSVYVAQKYYYPPCKPTATVVDCPTAPEQVIPSALYGTMIALLICILLNWILDMETQFKIMIILQLVLSIPCGFLMWFILGYEIVIVCATLAFIVGMMTWIMFFLRMIFFADFLQEAADDMGADTIDNLWIFAAILLYVQICRLFVGIVKLIIVTAD